MTNQIQQDFLTDAKGRLCPINSIPQIDVIKDDFVQNAITEAKAMQEQLAAFKLKMMNGVDDFVELLAQEHDVKLGGKKGNITLKSFDGKQRISVAVQEKIELDEKLSLAKKLIDECLDEWSSDSNSNIKTLVQRVFKTDDDGRVIPARILQLRSFDIVDDSGRWTKAMNLISDSINVFATARFIRFYERDEQNIERNIHLDVSKL